MDKQSSYSSLMALHAAKRLKLTQELSVSVVNSDPSSFTLASPSEPALLLSIPSLPESHDTSSENIVDELVSHLTYEEKRKWIQKQLEWIVHAEKCQQIECKSFSDSRLCNSPICRSLKHVLSHIPYCPTEKCPLPYCSSTKMIWLHWKNCKKSDCPVCSSLVMRGFGGKRAGTACPAGSNSPSTSNNSGEANWECTICYVENHGGESTCGACAAPKSKRIKTSDLEKLSQDLKELYNGEKSFDLTIKVKDREFKVHKAMLRARSSAFDAMISDDLSEDNSRIISIENCEPAVFEELLNFIYTSRTNLSSHNVCELYSTADKYELSGLKDQCISFLKDCFLKKSLSKETFWDVICLSITHKETELQDIANLFFAKNAEEILGSKKWQSFLNEHPVEANDLYIKGLKLGYIKKQL